ncbi:MAG TPA: alpha/beta hydrolase [Rhizomicrobium sp.]|jgi:non-heme chloroperoxidase
MASFAHTGDGLAIAFDDVGDGEPVLLAHGFGSSRLQNWKATGWYEVLGRAGFRVLAFDWRGHGESDKPRDATHYDHRTMIEDAIAVLDKACVSECPVIGYSLGGQLGLNIMMEQPSRLTRLVIGGVGQHYLEGAFARRFAIADALLAPDTDVITDPILRMFRNFAEQPGKDRAALAACMRGERRFYTAAELALSTRPALVVCGANDTISGPAEPLAAALHDGRALTLPGRDHMSAVGDRMAKQAVLAFLAA